MDTTILTRLEEARRPSNDASRQIVRATLDRNLRKRSGNVVEIGAGGGQLRDWLPADVAERTVHTEPSEPFLNVLKSRHPDAIALRADATKLPFPDRSVATIVGLCVLDAVSDLESIRDECRRVLEPDGTLVHFLDLGTNPDACFTDLIVTGEIPLPNFTQEPGLLDALSASRRARLPRTDPFDEVLAVNFDVFTSLVNLLRMSRHPLADGLDVYSRLSDARALDPYVLGQEFMRIRSDSARLKDVNRALISLALFAADFGRNLPLRPVSLRTHFQSRLKEVFTLASGFTIEFIGPMAVREESSEDRYIIRHAGRTLLSHQPVDVPGLLLGDRKTNPNSPFRSTSVEVFVTRRCPSEVVRISDS